MPGDSARRQLGPWRTGNELGFTSANALTTLLTTESLLFAAFSLSLSLPGSTAPREFLADRARVFGAAAALVLTVLAGGTVAAWVEVFAHPWIGHFGRCFPALTILVGALAQPTFAWVFVASISRGPRGDATDDV